MRIAVVLFLASLPAHSEDPLEIVRKSVHHDQSNWLKAKDYTYIVHSGMRRRDSHGRTTKVEQRTEEVLILFGEPYERLIAKDGKPLSDSEARKEQQKLDRLMEKRASESPGQRRKRLAERDRERQENRRFLEEVPEAYTFRLLGEDVIGGRSCWRLEADPRPGYQPKHSRAAMLKKFRGRVWVDKQEYQLTRLDVEAIDTVTWGLFLARLAKGSRLFIEQRRVNGEVWMPYRIQVDLDARLALFKRVQGELTVSFENFRKFQTDSRIVEAAGLK
ncbi:MAG: hypothetical protein IANPNBLG_03480 [Bryobacteraceae bacterium]|nr:hypothetical protein [Bryobacteraceae bacterium]